MSARKMLESLKAWDGTQRINLLATQAFGFNGLQEAERVSAYLQSFFVSAVRRAFEPGCNVDSLLILKGEQGACKSKLFRVLCGEHSSNVSLCPTFGLVDASWVHELTMDRGNSKGVKWLDGIARIYISTNCDAVRSPYRKEITSRKRSGIFVVTCNSFPNTYHRPHDCRRFHVVTIVTPIKTEIVAQWRDQLWAEAIAIYRAEKSGVPWWMNRAFA